MSVLAAVDAAAPSAEFADELASVARLLADQPLLRRGLIEPNTSVEQRAGFTKTLFAGKLSPSGLAVLQAAVSQSWKDARSLQAALHDASLRARWAAADAKGVTQEVRDQLITLASLVRANPEFGMALSDSQYPASAREGLLAKLLAKANPLTLAFANAALEEATSFDEAIQHALDSLAGLHQQLRAKVVSAAPLDPGQLAKLKAALVRIYAAPVELELVTDSSVLGGLRVEIGDEIIDGTLQRKLQQASKQVA